MRKIIAVISFCMLFTAGLSYGQEGEKAQNNSWEELIQVKVVGQEDTAARVELETTGKVKFHTFRVSNPPRLVIEMVDTVHNWRKKEIDVSSNLIKKIRSGQYKDEPVKMVRVVLDMATKDYKYEQVETNNNITVSVSLNEEGIKKQAAQKKTEKVKSSSKSSGLNLEPNVQTKEHKEKIKEVLTKKEKREKAREERLVKIEKINKDKSDTGSKEMKKDESDELSGYLPTEPVDFNFKGADIREVLRAFEIKLDKNILPSENVSGQVTLRLKNVPFNEAFNMLMERMDLVAVRTSPNIVEVMARSDMPTKRKTFKLANRKASEVQSTVSGLLTSEESADTTIVIDDVSNSLMVASTPEVLNKIALIISQIDQKSPQIKIKSRLIEVSAGEDFSTGITWATSIPFSGNATNRITEVRGAKDLSNYSLDSAGDIDNQNTIEGFGQGAVMDISAVLDNAQLYGVLNMLATNSEAKTLSEPTILTENNKSASIHVGQNLPVRTSEVTDSGTTQSIEFISEGVDLEVTPVVSSGSDQISMKVDRSVSELTGFRADNPITAERSAQTEVTVKSGKTVIIGGLIRETMTETESGIPLLKDIPLLGYLFKNSSTLKDRTELLIFLSPEILAE